MATLMVVDDEGDDGVVVVVELESEVGEEEEERVLVLSPCVNAVAHVTSYPSIRQSAVAVFASTRSSHTRPQTLLSNFRTSSKFVLDNRM